VLSGELGVSQAFVVRWYIGGSHMDVPQVVFCDCVQVYDKRVVSGTAQTTIRQRGSDNQMTVH